jgi:hypothetical protein
MLQAFAVYEGLTRYILPLCSANHERPNPDVPVTSCLYLVDISTLGFKQAWNVRVYVEIVSKLLADHYPEVIDRCFVGWQYFLKMFGSRT